MKQEVFSGKCYASDHPSKCLLLCVPVAWCRYACRGLFERHKLLFSFHMCAKILEAAGKLNVDEYNFFLRGGIVSLYTISISRF